MNGESPQVPNSALAMLSQCWMLAFAARLVKGIFPPALLNDLRACWQLEPRDRAVYWRLRLRRALGLEGGLPDPKHPRAVRSILFVCRGNIIRSPMAAALMEKLLSESGWQGVAVSSAGVRANPGEKADPRARAVAREFGVPLEGHRARPVSAGQVAGADMIFVMDSLNEAELVGAYPEACGKTFRLGAYAGEAGAEIIDPYDGTAGDIRCCYEILESSIVQLASHFTKEWIEQFERAANWFESACREARAQYAR